MAPTNQTMGLGVLVYPVDTHGDYKATVGCFALEGQSFIESTTHDVRHGNGRKPIICLIPRVCGFHCGRQARDDRCGATNGRGEASNAGGGGAGSRPESDPNASECLNLGRMTGQAHGRYRNTSRRDLWAAGGRQSLIVKHSSTALSALHKDYIAESLGAKWHYPS